MANKTTHNGFCIRTAHHRIVDAINNIEKYGWVRGTMGGPENGFCIAGALQWNDRSYSWSRDNSSQDRAEHTVSGQIPPQYSIRSFNDRIAKDKEEVLDILRKAAAACAPEPDTEFLNESEDQSRTIADRTDDRTATLTRA